MNVGTRPALVLVLLAVALAGWTATGRRSATAVRPVANLALTGAEREGALRFAPGTHPVDQAAVRQAIAAAQPDARRLIDIVDGAVTVAVGRPANRNAAGSTQPGPDGYAVILDLATVSHWSGERGISRLVLHELGHVVDFALVPPAMRAQLDRQIPAGYPCMAGDDASCAGRSAREERFAETFAKWASGDIGVGLNIGYRVLPPASLPDWGRPLATLR